MNDDEANRIEFATSQIRTELGSLSLHELTSPDWRHSSPASVAERCAESREISSAVAYEFARASLRPDSDNGGRLRDVLQRETAKSLLATDGDALLGLMMCSLHQLERVTIRIASRSESEDRMQLAASSRYLSDLCRLLLLDGSLQLLAATRPVNVARQVLRMDWNRELLDWLDRRGFGDWIDPSLCEELPGIVQRVPSDRLADDTATIVQLNAAVERISIWVSSR